MTPKRTVPVLMILALLLCMAPLCRAAYDLEVPADPWDEYRLQFKKYSQLLLKSYDRAFVNDYEGAIGEAGKAIEILPDEGLAYAERAKYYRILSNPKESERDFRKALTLFDQAIQRYRPGNKGNKGKKLPKNALRKVDPAESAKLLATLRYQRGEAYFSQEQYRQSRDDFGAACKDGSSAACSRLQDVELIEKRGINWVPLSTRQFYDNQRIERTSSNTVRVWVRREELQPSAANAGQGAMLQHLELRCESRQFRMLERLLVSNTGAITPEAVEDGLNSPTPGSAEGTLMVMFCSQRDLK